MLEFLFICLLALLVGSNIYWAVVCHGLVNKIMSRNYQEYVTSERQRKPTNVSARPKVALVDSIAEDNADKANRLFT